MISTNHTPGPWKVVPSNNIQTVGGEQLAIVSGRQTVGAGPGAEAKREANGRRDEANARLMASAPVLLEAIESVNLILEKLITTPSMTSLQRSLALLRAHDALLSIYLEATGQQQTPVLLMEPPTPLVDQVRNLYEELGASTV